jgi:hypothetical protein
MGWAGLGLTEIWVADLSIHIRTFIFATPALCNFFLFYNFFF